MKKYLFLTLLLITFHLFGNLFWLNLNKNPLDYDPIGHTLATINSAFYLKTNYNKFSLKEYMKISPGYPNFVETVSLPLVFIFGNHWRIIQFVGTIFFLLSIYAVFLYTKEISQNEKIGFLSAFFYSFFISIVQYSRFQMLDIPLISMFFLTLYFWERLKKTKAVKYWYLGVLTVAFAQTTKWHAGIFLLVPFIFLIKDLQEKKFFFQKNLIHFVLGGLISLILIIPWYYYNWSDFVRLGKINYLGEADDPKNWLDPKTLFFYFLLIVNFQTHFVGFIFIIIFLIFRQYQKKYLTIPILTSIFSYLFFSYFIPNKNIRVIFPIMPFIALFISETVIKILNLQSTSQKIMALFLKTLLFFAVFYNILAYFILSFAWPIKPKFYYAINLPIINHLNLIYLDTYPVDLLPTIKRIDYDQLINYLLSSSEFNQKSVKVLVGVHQRNFNLGTLTLEIYTKYRQNLSLAYEVLDKKINIVDLTDLFNKRINDKSLEKYDIIITANQPIHPKEVLNDLFQPAQTLKKYLFSSKNNQFNQDQLKIILPDQNQLLIFINKTSKMGFIYEQ